jgi:L-asparaginase
VRRKAALGPNLFLNLNEAVKIRIFTTGGTIDKIYFDRVSEFQVGESQIDEVLREAGASLDYKVESLLRKDSLDLTDGDRDLIRQAVAAAAEQNILVTHGTDTMIETALTLQGIPGKTIVLTGALQPARFRQTDAIFNIAAAVMAVQLLPEGAWVVMNGRVFAPEKVRKDREGNRFEEIGEA